MTDLKTPQLITVMMIPRRIVGILLPIPCGSDTSDTTDSTPFDIATEDSNY